MDAKIKAYLEANGMACLHCGSDEIYWGENIGYSEDKLLIDVNCRKCHKSWTDKYKLVGVTG